LAGTGALSNARRTAILAFETADFLGLSTDTQHVQFSKHAQYQHRNQEQGYNLEDHLEAKPRPGEMVFDRADSVLHTRSAEALKQ